MHILNVTPFTIINIDAQSSVEIKQISNKKIVSSLARNRAEVLY